MRLPTSKVYRAFPELDKFSDAQCAAYVKNATKERKKQHIAATCLLLIAVPLALFLAYGGTALSALLIFPDEKLFSDSFFAFILIHMTVLFFLECLGLLWLRDRWLRRIVTKHLLTVRCPHCRYVLLGLAVNDNTVTCPECGTRHTLASLGRTEADLAMNPPST